MTSLKHISKNFFILFTGNVLSQVIFFYGILLVAAKLTPEVFGRFSFAQAFTLFFLRLSEFGLETYSIRRLIVQGESSEIVFEFLQARIYFSAIVFGVALVCLFFINVPIEAKFIAMICLFSLFGNSFLLEWFYQAKEQMHIIGISRLIRSVVFTVPMIFVLKYSADAINISWLYVASFFIPSIILSFIYFNKSNSGFINIPITRLKELLKHCAPIGVSVTLMQIPFNVGTVMIGMLLNLESVGIYSAGYRISLVIWSFGIVAVYNAIYPTLTSLASNGVEFERLVKKLTLIFSIVSGFLIMGAISFSPIIIKILYQGKYDVSVDVLQISMITVSLILARTAIEYSLLALDKLKIYLIGMVFVSCLYIVTGYIGIVKYGINGMLYAACLSEVLYTIYLLWQFNYYCKSADIVMIWSKIAISIIISILVFFYISNYNEWIAILIMIGTFISLTYKLFKEQIKLFGFGW